MRFDICYSTNYNVTGSHSKRRVMPTLKISEVYKTVDVKLKFKMTVIICYLLKVREEDAGG